MFASQHPLEPDTLVLEIRGDEALDLHGALTLSPRQGGVDSEIMSALEAFYAGTSLERFHRPDNTAARLEYLRGELRAERISYGELIELQSLAQQIPADDLELREAAGLPEGDDGDR
jgi:hypothetical protein